MKKLLMIIALINFSVIALSQIPEINWQQCYGGSVEDMARDIIANDGNYFIIGGTSSVDGDVSFNHGTADAWIIKTDSTGNILWEKTYGGSNGEWFIKMIPASNNTFYLLGSTASSDGDISYDPYPGSRDMWILKIDTIGNILWETVIGGGMIDNIEFGTLAQDGGVVVFGWTGSQNGDISVNYGMYDMWLVKLNSNGDIEWDKNFGTDDFDFGNAIIQTSDGGFLIGGTSTIGYNGNLTCIPHSIHAEAIVIKLNSKGDIEWQSCYGGSEHDGVFGLLEIGDGYMISGYANSNDGDVTGHHGESDVWIIKIDFFGNIIWEHCYGGYRGEIAYNIFEETNGDFLIVGPTRSNDGDVSGNHSLSEYDEDIWVFRINNTGELLWQKCYGGAGKDGNIRFNALRKTSNNYLIATLTNYGPSYDVACTPHGGLMDKDWWVFEIDIEDTTGIFDTPAMHNNLKVYPNPARDYVVFTGATVNHRVTGSHPVSGTTVFIFDFYGRKINKPVIYYIENKIVWDTRQTKSGIYFYRVEIKGKSYSGKIVVQK